MPSSRRSLEEEEEKRLRSLRLPPCSVRPPYRGSDCRSGKKRTTSAVSPIIGGEPRTGEVMGRSMSRRALLILGLASVGLIGCMRQRVARAVPPPAAGLTLSTPEMEDLVALGEVLVEGRTLSPAGRQHLSEQIEDRGRQSFGSLSLYQTAASTLDRLAGRRFSTLDVRERIDFIVRHRLAAPIGRVEDAAESLDADVRALRMQVVPDLIRSYYASPAGWALVGYEAFPGRCGDLTRYTRAEA